MENEVKIDDVLVEMRNVKENLEAREAKLAEAERNFEREKQNRSALSKIGENKMDNEMEFRDFANAMVEKRSITVNGTGAVQQMNGLWGLIKQREPLLEKVSYFRGPNSQSQVAVLSARPAVPTKQAEGASSIASDTTASIASKSLYPYTWVSVLPVTYEACLYSISDIENRIPGLLAEAFSKAMCDNMFTGAGTNSTMRGFFADGAVDSNNLIETEVNTGVGIADIWNLALKVKDMDIANPVMVMNPAIYSALVTASVTGYDFLREELTRNKTVEGIPVVITGKAPTFAGVDAGKTVVWCGDPKEYAIALADEITIEPLKKPGDTNTYFQAVASFTGDIVQPKNVFGLKKKA